MKSGEVIAGRYRLDSRLGIGGMGEVWKATHDGTGREFAIKLMHAHAATSETARERFSREARASARINHPNVIDVFDAGEHSDGTLFMAMELLDGMSLADALHLTPPLSARDLLVLVYDTVRALEAAHAVGVIHRDIKPANIFLQRDRTTGFAAAKVLDFGISKFGGNEDGRQTSTDAVLGSPRYMSPEQTRSSANVDPRTDLWACGVILFEGLTGRWPHGGDSFSSLVLAICTEPPLSIDVVAPDLPEAVRHIVRDCLAPLDKRVPSAAELARRLASAVEDKTLADWPLPPPQNPGSSSRKVQSGMRVRPILHTTGDGSSAVTVDLGRDSFRITVPRETPMAPAKPVMPVKTEPMPVMPSPASPSSEPPKNPDPTLDTMSATTVRETPATRAAPAAPELEPDVSPLPSMRRRIIPAIAGITVAVGAAIALLGAFSGGSSEVPAPAASAAVTTTTTPTAAEVARPPGSESAAADPPPKPAATAAPIPSVTATASAAPTVAAASPPPAARPRGPAAPANPGGGSKVKQLGSGL